MTHGDAAPRNDPPGPPAVEPALALWLTVNDGQECFSLRLDAIQRIRWYRPYTSRISTIDNEVMLYADVFLASYAGPINPICLVDYAAHALAGALGLNGRDLARNAVGGPLVP